MKSSCSFFALERLFLLFLFFLFFIGSSVFPQTLINGKVTGRHGVPLSGATIAIKATNSFSTSDSAGRFSIKANPGAVIEFSFIGYHDQSLVLGNQTELNILLNETILNLNDVVLIGYGSTQRKDVTGSVAKVTPKEFNTGIITNPLQQLQGKVAGLVIVQPGGDPNGDFIVRLRGATSLEGQPPLLVIDGVALDDFNKAVTTLNPADIETYDILKDASAAAIYGTRGANGVILVTTKKSRAGKTSVEYAGFVGMENISNQVDLLNADQWRQATTNMNATDLDKGANTDWQKAIAQTGFSQSHLIAISGGSDQLNFRGSIGYISQQGVILNSGKNILTARLAADQKSFKNKLTIRYSLNASAINRDFLPDQNSTSQARTGGAFVFGQSLHYLPVWPVYNPDGSYFEPPNINLNPVFLLNELYSKQRENFFQASVNANYEILKGLKAGVLGALSRGNDVYDRFWPAIPGTPLGSEASKSNNNKQNFTGDIHGNYQKSFGKNTIDVTGVYEYNQFINDGFGVTARGFQVPDILNNNLGTATDINTNDIYSYKNEVKLISFLARAIYTYNDRYILTASFRRDGSSKFGPNYRWGNFPSVAVAWRADKENFLKDVKWLNNLKFRVSYGYTGNQENLPPNSYQTLYAPAGPYLNNGQVYQSYAGVQENNPDLKWEVRKSFNIGLDFSTLSNRLYGTIDVFNDNTSDMLFLYDLPQPPFLSPTVYANAASAFNKGVEVTLGAAVIKKNNFAWNVQGNIATLKNSITGLLGTFKGADLSLTNRHYGYAFGGGFGGTYVTQLEVGTLRVFFGSHNMLVLIMPGINYLTTTMPRGILPVLLPAIQTRIVCILIQPHIIPGVLQIVLPI